MVFQELQCITPGSSCFQIFTENSAVTLMGFPLYMTLVFVFLVAFNIHSFYFILSILAMITVRTFFSDVVYLLLCVFLISI